MLTNEINEVLRSATLSNEDKLLSTLLSLLFVPWIILQSVLTSDYFAKATDNSYGHVALGSAGQGPPREVGLTPTVSTSRPVALTHSSTVGSKKCGVLSKGFLASKSKPILRGAPLQIYSERGFVFVIGRIFRLFFQNSLDKPSRI